MKLLLTLTTKSRMTRKAGRNDPFFIFFIMKIPSKEECMDILARNKTPSNVIAHSKAVCQVAEDIAKKLIEKGENVNMDLVAAGALLHDIERVKDNHVQQGAKLLKEMGFDEVAQVISRHSLYKIEMPENQPKTWEEKIIFYADKRARGSKIVSLKERFDELEKRYKVKLDNEFAFAEKIEKELLE
jgi:putative nucleotidyltransferase with HDIG domain